MVTDKGDTGARTGRESALAEEYGGMTGAIESAIRYPAESDDVVKTVLIGGVLAVFSFLVVPLFVLAGYLVRVFDRTVAGDEVPPAFDEFSEMTVTGIKATVIGIVYGFVPLAVGIAAVLVGVAGVGIGVAGDGAVAGLGVLVAVVGGILWFALALLVGYLLPAALANFAQTRSIGSGFDVGTLKPIWTSRSYAVAWVTMFAVLLIGGFVTAVLNAVPILGTVAGAFVGFYFSVAAYSVIGRLWSSFPVPGDVRSGSSDAV